MSASRSALNRTQKEIIEAVVGFMIDSISELDANTAMNGLQAIIDESVMPKDISLFKSHGVWDCIAQAREIMLHPCPENRNESYPYVGQQEGFAMFKREKSAVKKITNEGNIELLNGRIISRDNIIRFSPTDNDFIAKEKNGLLGLTAREDNVTPPVTKNDIVNYIKYLVNQAIAKQEEKIKAARAALEDPSLTTIYSLPPELINLILSFRNRKDFRNFSNTCRLFKKVSKRATYNKLPAPPINFKAFMNSLVRDNHIIPLRHTKGGDSISYIMTLANGYLVTGTYGAKHGLLAQICVWHVASRKMVFEIETFHGQIYAIEEIAPNIIAVSLQKGVIEFYNLNNNKPIKIATINLPEKEKEHVCAFALTSPGQLAFVSYYFDMRNMTNCHYKLRVLHYNPTSIKSDTLRIEDISSTKHGLSHHGEFFSLDSSTVLVANTDGLRVFKLEGVDKHLPIKDITFPQEKQFPYVMKLRNGNILTAFITRNEIKRFILEIWDFSRKDGQERIKEISLPITEGSRGIYTIFERVNGDLLIIPDDNYCGTRIVVVNVNRECGKELIEEFKVSLYSLFHSQFIEDGRYFVTTCGTRADVVRFPLSEEDPQIRNCTELPRLSRK